MSPALPRGELARKLTHMGVGAIAFSLRYLGPAWAAVLAAVALVSNLLVLPRVGCKKLWRLVSFDSLPDELRDVGDSAAVLSPRIQRAIDELPDRLKRVLLLCELAGMSYGEIAAATGVKEGTVGSRRNRALALLRERLQPQEVVPDAERF